MISMRAFSSLVLAFLQRHAASSRVGNSCRVFLMILKSSSGSLRSFKFRLVVSGAVASFSSSTLGFGATAWAYDFLDFVAWVHGRALHSLHAAK